MNNSTLIMPMLGGSRADESPMQYRYDNYGKLYCISSLFAIPTDKFDNVIFVILKEHDEKYNVRNKIISELKSYKFSFKYTIDIVDKPTNSQAQTVYDTIKRHDIKGPIFIKDVDNICFCKDISTDNSVLTYSLEKISYVDPQHKSYISVDEQNFITNIIEKRVVSDLFNCGGYSFANCDDFICAYNKLKKYESDKNHMYISNIIYWLILNRNLKFRPVIADDYFDYVIKQN